MAVVVIYMCEVWSAQVPVNQRLFIQDLL